MVAPRPFTKIVIYHAIAAFTVKSVNGFVRDYRVALSELVADNLNGDIDATGQAANHRRLLREYAEDTYIEGMLESGQFENEAEARESLDKEDQDKIGAWVREQEKFVSEFAQAATAARLSDERTDEQNEAAQMDILRRVDLWGSALETLGSLGRAVGQGNVMVTWVLGPTEAHCTSGGGKVGCAELAGQRHRLKWFTSRGYYPRKNANDKITCGGWNCLCELQNDKKERVL